MCARLSSITGTVVPDQTSDRSASPSYRGPRITRFKLPQQLLRNSRVAVVQATDTWVRNYRAAAHARLSSTRRLFLQGQMSSVVVIQVDNLIPIVRSRERSVIRGIRGMGVLSGFMEHLQRVDEPCIAAVWNRTMKLGSSRYRSGCSTRAPVAECTVRRSPRLTAQHCWS